MMSQTLAAAAFAWSVAAGVGTALSACLLHYAASRLLLERSGKRFILWYAVSLAGRFALVVGVLVAVYMGGFFEPLRFTISFVISYLLLSVIEMRLLLRMGAWAGQRQAN